MDGGREVYAQQQPATAATGHQGGGGGGGCWKPVGESERTSALTRKGTEVKEGKEGKKAPSLHPSVRQSPSSSSFHRRPAIQLSLPCLPAHYYTTYTTYSVRGARQLIPQSVPRRVSEREGGRIEAAEAAAAKESVCSNTWYSTHL